MHKRNFSLKSGDCLNDADYSILTFDVKVHMETEDILILLPDPEDLDAVIATGKWMVKRDAEGTLDTGIEIVGPDGSSVAKHGTETAATEIGCAGGTCGDTKLDW